MRHLAIQLLLVLVALPGAAHAQTEMAPVECSEYVPAEERNDPKRLALRGVACFEANNYLVALRHYRRARELSDANLLNAALGRTFQELGHPFIAQRYYRDYLKGRIEDSDGGEKIRARLEAVEKELEEAPRVRVESSPPGATIYVVIEDTHWEELGETPLEVRMRPGKHEFIVERDGYVTYSENIDAGSKQDRIVRAQLVEDGAAFSVSGRRLRQIGIITMGASVPLMAGGTTLFLVGRNDRRNVEELPPGDREDARSRARRMQNWGIGISVVGIAALGTGLTLYLLGRSADSPGAPSDDPEGATPDATSRITPYFNAKTAGVTFRF